MMQHVLHPWAHLVRHIQRSFVPCERLDHRLLQSNHAFSHERGLQLPCCSAEGRLRQGEKEGGGRSVDFNTQAHNSPHTP